MTRKKKKRTAKKQQNPPAIPPDPRCLPKGGLRLSIELYWEHRISSAQNSGIRMDKGEWDTILKLFEEGIISSEAIAGTANDAMDDNEELAPAIHSPFVDDLCKTNGLVSGLNSNGKTSTKASTAS